jgi:hypothetical protein
MRSEIENAEADSTQRRYARLAGFLFLGEIILALGRGFFLSQFVEDFLQSLRRCLRRGATQCLRQYHLSSRRW